MKVLVLKNQGQANQLKGKEYAKGKKFNPIEDADGEVVISITERDEYLELTDKVKNKQFKFLLELSEKEHNPKIEEL